VVGLIAIPLIMVFIGSMRLFNKEIKTSSKLLVLFGILIIIFEIIFLYYYVYRFIPKY